MIDAIKIVASILIVFIALIVYDSEMGGNILLVMLAFILLAVWL